MDCSIMKSTASSFAGLVGVANPSGGLDQIARARWLRLSVGANILGSQTKLAALRQGKTCNRAEVDTARRHKFSLCL